MTHQTSPLWTPDDAFLDNHPFCLFQDFVEKRHEISFAHYEDMHRWSVKQADVFWDAIWDYFDVIGDKGTRLHTKGTTMREDAFFPDAELNYAENLLRYKGRETALIFRGEDKLHNRLSWDELYRQVSQAQQGLQKLGIKKGKRVAAMMPNMSETIIFMLAATSLGAVWCSCSPDFGINGVLDRFAQIEPSVFIVCDGYWYNGKQISVQEKVPEIVKGLPSVKASIIVPYLGGSYLRDLVEAAENAVSMDAFLDPFVPREVNFERIGFNDPLFILFSSGTTGVPKCIVHRNGGVLLQHLKEHALHCGLQKDDRFFYFTTCGWMMWNWLVSGLALGCTLCLYDGSPFAVKSDYLFDYAQDERFKLFGTSAKYIDALRKEGLSPQKSHDLSALKVLTSTGSPLAPENFSYVYEHIKQDVHLASISGGTDIVSCFVLGVPLLPVYSGEIQRAGLGMDVKIWDENCEEAPPSIKGELVCKSAFPSMPLHFWNDKDGEKYRTAYFERYDATWCHGDFAERTPHGGLIIHGRSDATLNPGGVRIGTAEIYNQVEPLEEIIEALAIGQEWDGDVRVVLFVRVAKGIQLDEQLITKLKTAIRKGASPRHVPAHIIAVDDIPRTKSGKIVELAVRDIVHGREVKNKTAIANPEALALFKDLPQLRS